MFFSPSRHVEWACDIPPIFSRHLVSSASRGRKADTLNAIYSPAAQYFVAIKVGSAHCRALGLCRVLIVYSLLVYAFLTSTRVSSRNEAERGVRTDQYEAPGVCVCVRGGEGGDWNVATRLVGSKVGHRLSFPGEYPSTLRLPRNGLRCMSKGENRYSACTLQMRT